MPRMAVALRLRTNRDRHAHATNAYTDISMLTKRIEEKRLRTNNELEYNRLFGASQFGQMTPFALGRLNDLENMLKRMTAAVARSADPAQALSRILIY